MCEEESEDTEAVAKLFEINDSIHRTIERYKLIKKGDVEAANQIRQGTLGRSGAGVSKGPDNTLNLIDFGDPEPAPAAAAPSAGGPAQLAPKGNALEDDLLGLSLGGSNYGQSGSISLGGSNGSGRFRKTPGGSSVHANRFQYLVSLACQYPNHKSNSRLPHNLSTIYSSLFLAPATHLKYRHLYPPQHLHNRSRKHRDQHRTRSLL
jgi:hypothetical protein